MGVDKPTNTYWHLAPLHMHVPRRLPDKHSKSPGQPNKQRLSPGITNPHPVWWLAHLSSLEEEEDEEEKEECGQ